MSAPQTPQHPGTASRPGIASRGRPRAISRAACASSPGSRCRLCPGSPWATPFRISERCRGCFRSQGAIIGPRPGRGLLTCDALGLGPGWRRAFAVAALVLVTGGLHEDGLGDTADGFGGGATVERRLEIMRRQPGVGSFGRDRRSRSPLHAADRLDRDARASASPCFPAPQRCSSARAFSRTAALIVMAVLRSARARPEPSLRSGRPSSATIAVAGVMAALIGVTACVGTGTAAARARRSRSSRVAGRAGRRAAGLATHRGADRRRRRGAQQVAEVAALTGLLLRGAGLSRPARPAVRPRLRRRSNQVEMRARGLRGIILQPRR
jgi:adenosylcobinamide-GDP ribazoletransferase